MSAALISAGMSAMAGINSAITQRSGYKIQEMQANSQAARARLQGDADALSLIENFNKSMASDTVMAAAQGRSGGSVDAIASSAESKYNWDLDFTDLSTKIRAGGYEAQAIQASLAKDYALIGGVTNALLGAGSQAGASLYSIGGSTKPEEYTGIEGRVGGNSGIGGR